MNAEERKAYMKEYRKKNKDKISASINKFKENNPERYKEIRTKAEKKYYEKNKVEINRKKSQNNGTGKVKCLECRSTYDAVFAVENGFKRITRFTVICC